MIKKARGRPPVYKHTSIRMSRGTKLRLKNMARDMGMKQGKVLEIALERLYDDA